MTSPSPLADGFSPSTEADWRALVARAGGRTPDDLISCSDDGIAVGPIYPRPRTAMPSRAGRPASAGGSSSVCGPPTRPPPQRCAAEAVAGGADGIAAVFATSPHPLPGGLSAAAATDLVRAFSDALPDGAVLTSMRVKRRRRWRPGSSKPPCASGGVWRWPSIRLPALPRSAAGRTVEDSAADIVAMARSFDAQAVHGTVAIADGRLWHAGGATEAQELAAVLATVVWLLHRFEADGYAPDAAATRIAVALAADADQFLTIAKFRAVRLLTARVFEAAGFGAAAAGPRRDRVADDGRPRSSHQHPENHDRRLLGRGWWRRLDCRVAV